MSPTLRRIFIALLCLTAVTALIWWLARPKPIAVALHTVERGKVESSIANTRAGTVEACLRTKLSPIVGGRIELLPVREGDRVSKGQLLMKLWNDDQQAQRALAQTQVATARQHVAEACAQATNAVREAERQTTLREKGFVSPSREESARTDAQARQAACAAARADVAQFQAKVTAVGVPTPPAIDLIDDSCLYVEAPMDEVDAPKIHPGQAVRISLDAMPGRHFPGKVKRIAPYITAVEKQARTVDVEATFDDPAAPGTLLVGYSADLEVILAVREDVVRIPTSALLEGSRVLVAGADGRLIERRIKTGLSNWEFVEVVDGLQAGERVVISLERAGVKADAPYVADAADKAGTESASR